jgi:hypothetical protein
MKKGGSMSKVINAEMISVPKRGNICLIALDEWPEDLNPGDKIPVGGVEFDFEVELIRFRGAPDMRPHLALMLGDEEIDAGWFLGKKVDRSRPRA